MDRLKNYYWLTKPGIIYGNLLTATGGFLLASNGRINYGLLIATFAGIAFVIASACVFNNYIDRGIDKKMARTKKRALVIGKISPYSAKVYAACLGIIGFLLLAVFTNFLTVCIGLIAYVFYIVFYGYTKRRSVHGTLVGTVPGAAPIVAGYTAAANVLDSAAITLFFVLVFWQLAHFYSIAIFRFDDYKNANLPVMPVKKGMTKTKLLILLYVICFIVATGMLSAYGHTGLAFLVGMGLFGMIWFWIALDGFKAKDDKRWARRMVFVSLIVIAALSIMLSINWMLP